MGWKTDSFTRRLPRRAAPLAGISLLLGCAGGGAPERAAPPEPAPMVEPAVAAPAAPAPAAEPSDPRGVDLDTVRAGAFDNGRMWTFEYPPTEYFRTTYGFDPTEEWFRRARMGALRIPGCSASFVSPRGLVMTNHHCGREHVTAVTREGETLADDGFYAATLEEERAVEDLEADQLIDILDVTDEVYAALEGVTGDSERANVRETTLEAIEERIAEERGGEEAGIAVEMISLYNGGRYSAYVFRRYTDVRLVMTPESEIGSFGGDPDNWTYPRYSLDFTFFRVYENGEPLDTSDEYLHWSRNGVHEGDAIFVIGNPASTSRLQTISELEFRRDVSDKGVLEFLDSRVAALQEFYELERGQAESLDLRNSILSLLNSQKAYRGMLRGLHDPVIMAKRADQQRKFAKAMAEDPTLAAQYGGHIDRMAEIQDEKRRVAPGFGSFLGFTAPEYASSTLIRALYAFQYVSASSGGAPVEMLDDLKTEIAGVRQQPPRLEESLVEARIEDVIRSYGADSQVARRILGGRSPEGAATSIVNNSLLADSASAMEAVESGTLAMSDPALEMMTALISVLGPFQQVLNSVSDEEEEIASDLGRARLEIYGTDVPPDATFSLRISDGVVSGYEYNGTVAPILTTFYGLYDRYYSHGAGHGAGAEWDLPERWLDPPSTFDLSTPLNFVSTADIIGGSSGSPVVNQDLELVGLAFDGNIESLPGDYIFQTDPARTVSVDVRGILEALEDIYQAERIVEELTVGARMGAP